MRSDENPNVAVAQDIGHLFGLQQRIDRYEHAAGQRGTEQSSDGFQAFRQINGDPLGSIQVERQQAAGRSLNQTGESGVIQAGLPVNDCDGGGRAFRLFENEFVQQSGHACG